MPNRHQRDRTAFILDPEYWSVAYLRNWEMYPLDKVGAADTNVMESEYTLEGRNEGSSGCVADLTTS